MCFFTIIYRRFEKQLLSLTARSITAESPDFSKSTLIYFYYPVTRSNDAITIEYVGKYSNRQNIKTCIIINPLTPNDTYSGRTAPLTSKRYILYIYSTNIGTEYFKQGIYSSSILFKMQFVS